MGALRGGVGGSVWHRSAFGAARLSIYVTADAVFTDHDSGLAADHPFGVVHPSAAAVVAPAPGALDRPHGRGPLGCQCWDRASENQNDCTEGFHLVGKLLKATNRPIIGIDSCVYFGGLHKYLRIGLLSMSTRPAKIPAMRCLTSILSHLTVPELEV